MRVARGAGRGFLRGFVVGVGDAELCRVLVLARGVVDQLQTVALGAVARRDVVLDRPAEYPAVLDLLGDGVLFMG